MPITVRMEKTLEPGLWGDDEEFADMNDAEILELLQEDILTVIHGAIWEVVRTDAAAGAAKGE